MYSCLLNWTHVGIIRNGVVLHPMAVFVGHVFYICVPHGYSISHGFLCFFWWLLLNLHYSYMKRSTSRAQLGPWFSGYALWGYYQDSGGFLKKLSNCCYSTHGFNSAGESRYSIICHLPVKVCRNRLAPNFCNCWKILVKGVMVYETKFYWFIERSNGGLNALTYNNPWCR